MNSKSKESNIRKLINIFHRKEEIGGTPKGEPITCDLITGTTKHSNTSLTFAYVGTDEKNKSIWASLLLQNYSLQKIGPYAEYELIKALKTGYPNCSIILWEQNPSLSKIIPTKNSFLIPRFINTEIDISWPIEVLCKRSKSGFDRIRRWINANNLSFEFTCAEEYQKDFYYNMYLPFVEERYENSSLILKYQDMFSDSVQSEVLLIKIDKNVVAGAVIQFLEKGPTLGFLGVKKDHLTKIKRWNTGAAYYFLARELHNRGYEKLFIGGSPSFMKNGLLLFKMKLLVKLDSQEPYRQSGCVSFKVLNDSEGVRDFLSSNPFIYKKETGSMCGVIWAKPGAFASFEDFEKEANQVFRLGLDECQIIVWDEDSVPKEWLAGFNGRKIYTTRAKQFVN